MFSIRSGLVYLHRLHDLSEQRPHIRLTSWPGSTRHPVEHLPSSDEGGGEKYVRFCAAPQKNEQAARHDEGTRM